jgi:(E)-4-hydroxy-3-methylbut-2-enyl-diphosphate synthase
LIARRQSKPVNVGTVTIGGDAPVVVQSMTKTDTRNIPATTTQVRELADCGCEIVRMAVPDNEAAKALSTIKRSSPIPIIADIHFDYRLALAALKANVDGLRLNPGNIRNPEQIASVVRAAKERSVPIRIGINAGSLPPASKPYLSIAEHMVSAAIEQIHLLESLDFDLIKVSLKAFNVPTTIEAYRLIAARIPYPLHLGITEAGLPRAGAIRSAVGIGILLHDGIGDTIRVSLSTPPSEEVYTAFEILKSLELRQKGPTLISCPSCGRSEIDIISLAESVDRNLRKISKPIKVAVMGCVVNGPGEAKEADVGIACGKGKGALFRKGRIIRTVPEKDLLKSLMLEIDNLLTLD